MNKIKHKVLVYTSLIEDSSSRAHWLTLSTIIIIGFILRYYSLEVGQAYTYFAINDEVTALKYALGFLAGEPHMLYLGSPALNQGNIPGPLWAMLVAGMYKLFGSTAEGAIFGMIVLNTLAIYFVYRLAKAIMPNRYALFSSLLYSLAPWVIYYSAGLYNPIPLALIGAVLFLALWQTTQTDNSKAIFWVCLLAACIPQFHMIGIFYYPAILLLLYISPVKINRLWLVVGIFSGIALYLPYLFGEMAHHWENTHKLLISDSHFSFGILKIITIPISMLADHPGQWAGHSFNDFKQFGDSCFGSYILLLIVNLFSLGLAIFIVSSFIKHFSQSLFAGKGSLRARYKRHAPSIFVGILLVLPLISYTFTGRGYTTRYSILLFPLLFLLPSLVLQNMSNRLKAEKLTKALLVITFFNVCMVITFYNYQDFLLKTSTFMPSFKHLAKIKTSIDHAIGKGELIDISFSDDILKLPEGQRKLYMTIPQYLEIYHDQTPTQGRPFKTRKLRVLLAGKNSINHDNLIYSSQAINIIDITHTEFLQK